MKKLIAFFKEEDGLELTEYAVMGALIVIGLLLAIQGLTGAVSEAFARITSVITQAGTTATS